MCITNIQYLCPLWAVLRVEPAETIVAVERLSLGLLFLATICGTVLYSTSKQTSVKVKRWMIDNCWGNLSCLMKVVPILKLVPSMGYCCGSVEALGEFESLHVEVVFGMNLERRVLCTLIYLVFVLLLYLGLDEV